MGVEEGFALGACADLGHARSSHGEPTRQGFGAARSKPRITVRLCDERVAGAGHEGFVRADEQDVAARSNGGNGRCFNLLRESSHLQIVRDQDPLVAEVGPQQIMRDRTCQGRGGLVELGVRDVRAHERRHMGARRESEWWELGRFELHPALANHGQLEVRIGGCVSVSWKMFSTSEELSLGEPFGESEREACGVLGASTERTVPDDGVRGIRVDIEDRGEIHGQSE